MTSSLPPIQIHVLKPGENDDDESLTDVGVVNLNGERHLFLIPQSFGSAVRQVSSAMPDLPLEQVEHLVRKHCPEFKDLDELLGPVESAPPIDTPGPSAKPTQTARVPGRAKKWAIAAALAPVLAGTWALGYVTADNTAGPAVSSPDVADKVAPFTASDFMNFSDAGKIDCNPIDNLEAECTDSDGMVMASKAATGPDSTIFTFSYGSERIGLRIFRDADYAATWTRQDGSQELYPNLARFGRYVLWGTDKERLDQYLKLLRSAPKKSTSAQFLGTGALPPRLAALTLGTLGLNEHDVRTILFTPQDSPVDMPVLMAAQAVLGLDDDAPRSTVIVGEDDIVALAVGIEPQPVVSAPSTRTEGNVVLITAPVDSGSTSSGGSSGVPQQAAPVPVADPAPETTPEPSSDGQPQMPVEERPTPEPEQPTEPEQLDPSPTGPTVPVAEAPAPAPELDSAEPPPSAEGDAATAEQPVPPAQEDPGVGDDEEATGGGLLALPEAWIAPAA